MTKTQWILSQLTRKLWFRSSLFAVLAVITALLAIVIKPFIPMSVSGLIGTDAVDKILQILASSMLAVTTFSLNIMVSAYNTASSSVTPRATRLLVEDGTTQNVLATFIGSFLYSLVGIVALSMGAYGTQGRVILFFVTLMVILAIIITLLRWIQHLAQFGRMADTTQLVEDVTAAALKQRVEDPYMGCSPWHRLSAALPKSAVPVYPAEVGYLQHVDMNTLSDFADRHGCYFYLTVQPGTFVHLTRPLFWFSSTETLSADDLINAFTLGPQRSFDQDPRFGLCVLSEVASRALSAGINDPGTAIDIIGRAIRLFSIKFDTPANNPRFPRLYMEELSVSDMFDDIFYTFARDGAGLFEVQTRLQKAFIALAQYSPAQYGIEARRHSALALSYASITIKNESELDRLRTLAHELESLPANPG